MVKNVVEGARIARRFTYLSLARVLARRELGKASRGTDPRLSLPQICRETLGAGVSASNRPSARPI